MENPNAPVIAGHEVLDRLGSGGTGEVWVVRRPDGVRLAAKLIHRHLQVCPDKENLLRRIDHDHVVRLHDAVDEDGGDCRRVLLLDLAEGGSLADAIAARRTLTPGEIVTVLTPIARTLHDLHGLGLVHADISTGNILFTDAGKPLLADLGVSRVAGTYDEHTWATEAWAAPEVLAGAHPTPASDVYSLGAVAWACVVGSPPPPQLDRTPLLHIAPHADPAIAELIERALSFEADDRPDPGDFALVLWRCAQPEPAPVAGSRGCRGVSAQDDGQLLTRRMIRETKATEEDSPAAASQGLITRLTTAVQRRNIAMRPAVGAALVTALTAVGAWTLVPQQTSLAQGSLTAVSPAAVAATSPSNSAASSVAPSHAPQTSQPAVVPPRVVVADLVASRARAWEREDPALLVHALAPGSPADTADRAALITATKDRIDYRGLDFAVEKVSVVSSGRARLSVQATIRRSTYSVTAGTGTPQVHPESIQRVRLELVKVGGQWRIERWS